MTRIFLKILNTPVLILIGIMGVAIQTSLFAWWPLTYLQPDVILLIVIWCGLRRQFIEGGIISLVLGSTAEIHSASPQGVLLIDYMAVFLLIRGANKILVIPDLASYVILTLFASIGAKLINLGVMVLLVPSLELWRNTLYLLFPGAAIAGIVSIWVYRWLERFDFITYKIRPREDSLETDLHLDEGEALF